MPSPAPAMTPSASAVRPFALRALLAAAAAGFCAPGAADSGEAALRVEAPPVVQRCPAYCAPASLSRALAVEGVEADQDEIARVGGCSPEEGADLDALCARLAPWLRARGLRIRILSEFDAPAALALAWRYNGLADREGFAPLPIPPAGSDAPVSLDRLFEGAWLEPMRRLTEDGLPAFRNRVRSVLSEGRPVLWGVVLGIADEPAAPAAFSRGGHLRLIVGHDPGPGLVFYSDPWGPSCSVRAMPEADACAITMSLRALVPADDSDVDAILAGWDPADAILNGWDEVDRILAGF